MDITKELDDIIIKYNLDKDYPLYRKWIKENRPQNHYFIRKRITDFGKRDSLDREDERELEVLEYYNLKEQLVDGEDKICIYRKLFFISLVIKNFLKAEEWMKKLREAQDDTVSAAWNNIQELLENITTELELKSQEHIIMYWMDNISEEEAKNMKYIQSRKKHSVYFSEAYTVTPNTHPTANMIFCRINQMFDQGYNNRKINRENSELLRCMYENGYDVCIISGYLQKMFTDSYIAKGMRVKESCASVYWKLWEELLKRDRPTFFVVHSLVETHYPFIGTYLERNIANSSHEVQRYRLGIKEVDSQIEFYDSPIGKKTYRIYMSDHGNLYFKIRFHVHMQVYHYNWRGEMLDSIFSVQSMSDMLEELVNDKKVTSKKYKREYAEICDVAHYNKTDIENGIRYNKIDFSKYIGYVGVITAQYYYLRYENGYEWFATKENMYEDVCMISDLQTDNYDLKICRSLCKNIPYEYINDDKFKYSKYVYRIYENVKTCIQEIKEIIQNRLQLYEDGSIAIRMGAWHSMQLYNLLDKKVWRKFGAIIDINQNCSCKTLGLPIYEPQAVLPDNIKSILLSSRIHLQELKTEAQMYYGNYNVIDIYEILSMEGIELEDEFIFGTKECYDVGFPFDKVSK